MPFDPFPENSDIATYSEDQIPFRVPADMGYADGDVVGHMDPIGVPPSAMKNAAIASLAAAAGSPPQKHVSFNRPRSSSHGQYKKSVVAALNPFSSSKRRRHDSLERRAAAASSQQHTQSSSSSRRHRAYSDSSNMRPNMAMYASDRARFNESAIDDSMMPQPMGYPNVSSNQPVSAHLDSNSNYILYSTNGLSYGVSNKTDMTKQPLKYPSDSHLSQTEQTRRAQGYHVPAAQDMPPAYAPHRPSPLANQVPTTAVTHRQSGNSIFSLVEILNILRAPVLAVENPDARIFVVAIEGVVLLAVFNWLTSVFDNGFTTLAVLGLAIVVLNMQGGSGRAKRNGVVGAATAGAAGRGSPSRVKTRKAVPYH